MGDREATIRSAIRELNQEEDIEVRKVSSLIRTAPMAEWQRASF